MMRSLRCGGSIMNRIITASRGGGRGSGVVRAALGSWGAVGGVGDAELRFRHGEIEAVLLDQFLMRTALDDAAFIHDEDFVAIDHGAEAMADEQNRSLPLQAAQGL